MIGERGRVSHTAQRGIPGYGTAQELLFMRELLQRHRVRPDLVVQVFFTNDILDNRCLSYGNLTALPPLLHAPQ